MINTGIIMRIEEIVNNDYSLVTAVVRPGAIEYIQHHKKTKITYDITTGTAELEIEERRKKIKKKNKETLESGLKHRLINRGREPWRFRGKFEPPWDPDDVTYEYKGKEIPGDQLWFEIKASAGDITLGVKYLIGKYKPKASNYVVLLEPGVQGLIEYHEEGTHTITGISGKGIISMNGVRRELGVNDSLVIEPMQRFQFINPNKEVWEMQGTAEPPWDPSETFYILPNEIIVPGNDIWFEIVLPTEEKDFKKIKKA